MLSHMFEYYVNVFAESKPHIHELAFTFVSVYVDSERFSDGALLHWCRSEFAVTEPAVKSKMCPKCLVRFFVGQSGF